MAKKWHTRGTHALSSGVAVVTLVSAGIAAASQGGILHATDRPSVASDATTVVASAGGAVGYGGGSSGYVAGGTEGGLTFRDPSIPLIPGACEDALSSAKVSMPRGDDASGIQHAIDVVAANCANAPQAQGLLNALDHLLGNANGHAGGNGKGYGAGGNPDAGGYGAGGNPDAGGYGAGGNPDAGGYGAGGNPDAGSNAGGNGGGPK